MISAAKEKVFDIVFDSLKDRIEVVKEKKELRSFIKDYFNEYFESIDFNEEFDFVLVTEYLLNNYEKIYNNPDPQNSIDAIISGCIARGNGSELQIKRYCYTFLSFWESIIQRNIPRESWYLVYELEKHINKEIQTLYNNLKTQLNTSENNIFLANDLYVDSFCETLFLHKGKINSKVNLSNLFVEQKYLEITTNGVSKPKNDLISRVGKFFNDDIKQVLLIEGDAGNGKSSLIGFLNYHYKKGDLSLFSDHSLVTIRLRDLDRRMISESKNISDAILSYMRINNFEVFDTLFSNPVLILDGFDELCMIDNITNYERLIYDLWHRLSKNTKILITSRPKYLSIQNLDLPIRSIFLCHFDREKRIAWINNFISKDCCNEVIDKKIRQYVEKIDESEAIGICDTPMSLYMLVSKKIDDNALNNIWELYHQIFYNELSETEYNKMFHNPQRDYFHRISEYRDLLYQITEEIAYDMYCSNNNKFVISAKELEKIVKRVLDSNETYDNNTIRELTEKCYALCNYWKVDSGDGVVEFYHNNIRDFFLCEKIYREMNTLYSDYQNDTKLLSHHLRELFEKSFNYGLFDTMVCKFILLRAIYDKKDGKRDLPYYEKKNPCLPYVFGFMLSNLSDMVFQGNNPIQIIINLLSTVAQVYRHIYEPYLGKDDKIIWWNNVYQVNENGVLQYVFKYVFSQVPVTLDYDEALTMASKSNFRGVDLQNCDLRNIGFQGSDFTGANFSNAILVGCDFTEATLEGTDFSNANMSYTCMKNADLSASKFIGTQLQGAMLPNEQSSLDQATQIKELKNLEIKGLIIC